MRAHLLSIAACIALASGIGCARGESHVASYPQAPAAPQMQPSVPETMSELHRASRPEDHFVKAKPSQAPVSITGQLPYAERFDPSGWSGSSLPKATGGGPAPEATDVPSGNEPVGAEQGLVPSASKGLEPKEKAEPPKKPAKNDDLIDEYQ